MSKNKSLFGAFLVIASGIMWGHSTYFVHGLSDCGIKETGAAVTRLVAAFIFMAIFMVIFHIRDLKIGAKAVLYSCLGGLIGMVLCTVIYYYSINENGSAVAAVLMYTSPAIVTILSLIIFREKITNIKIISLILAFAGTICVSGLIGGSNRITFIGLIFGLITGVAYALYSIFSELAMKNGATPFAVIFYALGAASAAIVVFTLIKGEFIPTLKLAVGSKKSMLLVFGQSTFDCILPYIAYTIGVKYTGPSKAAIMSTVEMIEASLIGFVSFGERLGLFVIIGIALIIPSIVILNVNFKKHE